MGIVSTSNEMMGSTWPPRTSLMMLATALCASSVVRTYVLVGIFVLQTQENPTWGLAQVGFTVIGKRTECGCPHIRVVTQFCASIWSVPQLYSVVKQHLLKSLYQFPVRRQ